MSQGRRFRYWRIGKAHDQSVADTVFARVGPLSGRSDAAGDRGFSGGAGASRCGARFMGSNVYPMAEIEAARALCFVSGDKDSMASAAYQRFLALWADADQDQLVKSAREASAKSKANGGFPIRQQPLSRLSWRVERRFVGLSERYREIVGSWKSTPTSRFAFWVAAKSS